MKLYDYDKEFERLIAEATDPETGEVSDDIDDKLNDLSMERDQKIANVVYYIKERLAEAEALKTEADKLSKRRKVAENDANNLKNYLAYCLNYEPYKNGIIDIRFRNSESVHITNEDLIDDEYMVISRAPSKTAIKAAIKSGVEVEGAEIVENRSIIIK